MQNGIRTTLRGLSATSILATSILATSILAGPAQAAGNGWAHLSPWSPPAAGGLDQVGRGVALGDGWAFVGAAGENEIHVWRRDGGTWSFHQTIDEDPGLGLGFGSVLDYDAGVLYAGADSADIGADGAGAVLAYELVGNQWVQTQTIQHGAPDDGDQFGKALDVNGDWMAVTAFGDGSKGTVHVFRRVGGVWQHRAELTDDDAVKIGTDVAIAGTESGIFANVFAGDPNANGHDGAVFHFRVHPFGWQAGPTTYPESNLTGFSWGGEVEFDGEHLVVGAGFGAQQGASTGEVAIYDTDGEQFPPQIQFTQTLFPDIGQVGSRFGQYMDLDGDRLAIGAPEHFPNEVQITGAVHVFRPESVGDDWELEDLLLSDGAGHGDWLGGAVALDGDLLLAGAPFHGNLEGNAVLFSLGSQSFGGGQAPNDVLATATEYGQGKAGKVGVPVLSAQTLPVPGEAAEMGISNALEGTLPLVAWGLSPLALPFDDGTLLVNPVEVVPMPVIDPAGESNWAWNIGTAPAMSGTAIYLQGFMLDPAAAGPLGTAQTNGLELIVGY